MAEILKVKDLCRDTILKDVSLTVDEGEMVAVMGPSGSGKSTLLYCVSGMEGATSGEIRFEDTQICRIPKGGAGEMLSEDQLARLRLERMGFVFQQMNMLSNLNIFDNILLPAVHAGKRPKEELRQQAKALMEKMSIGELAGRKITEVSGGQLQRACICRSMMNQPKILFADEPTGALNQSAAAEVMEELDRLNGEGTTILMVTHDSRIAGQCSRILYLLDGGIKGELQLSGIPVKQENEREEKVNAWLAAMGW